jgi:MYXO-CTERM domain-containing protein
MTPRVILARMKPRLSPLAAILFALAAFAVVPAARAQTTLVAGDVAVIAVHADAPDLIAMVALRDIEEGTVLRITDNGWRSSGGFRVGEGIHDYVFADDVTAGTVFTYSPPDEMGFIRLATSGDQVFLFQGTVNESTGHFMGTLIWGAHSHGSTWDSSGSDANASAQPPALVGYSVAIPDVDNYAYSGPTDLSREDLIAALTDPDNYTASDSASPTYPTSFTFGTAADAGVADGGAADAGAALDAFVPPRDAAIISDASEELDASADSDAGEELDASEDLDASTDGDASVASDASITWDFDASTNRDAAVTSDAAVRPDAGMTLLPAEGGCSCAVGGRDEQDAEKTAVAWLSLLGAVAFVRRRAKR